jgi:hypothetical protein
MTLLIILTIHLKFKNSFVTYISAALNHCQCRLFWFFLRRSSFRGQNGINMKKKLYRRSEQHLFELNLAIILQLE